MAWALQTPGDAAGLAAPADFSGQSFWRWALEQGNDALFSAGDNTVAKSWARRDLSSWPQAGLPDGYSIARPSALVGLHISLSARGHWGQPIKAESSAHAFFSWPPDQQQAAMSSPSSLYQPFWQARLADLRSAGGPT